MSEPVYVTNRIRTHGRSGYNRGCRCEVCREACNTYQREQRAIRAQRTEDAPHGTRGGYVNWGCRCDPCSKVHSDYMKAYWEGRA